MLRLEKTPGLFFPSAYEVRAKDAKVSGKSNLCVFEVVVLCSLAVLPASYFD